MYFVVRPSEDGATVDFYNKEQLLEELEEWEHWDFIETVDELRGIGTDPNYWGDRLLIIKGDVVKPEPIKKIIEYDIK